MAVANPERYANPDDLASIFTTVKSYILAHSGGGGGGGGTSEPDGDYVINRNSLGEVQSIVFTDYPVTYTQTTTFVTTSTSKIIVELKVMTGASTGTQKTTTITGDQISVRTITVPVS